MIKIYNKIFKDNNNWIIEVDSGKPWKTFTVVASTHWNETAWLFVFDYLLNDFDIESKLKSWKIILIVWNIEAFKKWKRYIDFDFNRIWDFEDKYKDSYEFKRAMQIKEYLDKSDILLDIHSTTLKTEPFFIITSDYIEKDILNHINASYLIKNIKSFLSWKLLSSYMSEQKKWNFSMVLEAWSHNSESTRELSKHNTINILKYYNLIDWEAEKFSMDSFEVKKCIKAKSKDIKYLYHDNPESFQKIGQAEHIMYNWEELIISEDDYFTLMPSQANHIWDEILYLLHKNK